MVAGDDERAAYAFLGTTTPCNDQDIASCHGVWHLYVATTYGGGASWGTVDRPRHSSHSVSPHHSSDS